MFRVKCDYVTKKGIGVSCKSYGNYEICDKNNDNTITSCRVHIRMVCKQYENERKIFRVHKEGFMVPCDIQGNAIRGDPPPPPSNDPLCLICYEPTINGVLCNEKTHCVCSDCFSDYVKINSNKPDFCGEIKCVNCVQGCTSSPFLVSTIAKNVSNEIFQIYHTALIKKHEKKIILEFKKINEAEKNKHIDLRSDKVQTERLHIIEHILTLKCPNENCNKAFLDFDGCIALRCPNCYQHFCGKCLIKTNEDTENHQHVRICINKDSYFLTEKKFIKYQASRRSKAVHKYLENESSDFKKQIINACLQDFSDLQMNVVF